MGTDPLISFPIFISRASLQMLSAGGAWDTCEYLVDGHLLYYLYLSYFLPLSKEAHRSVCMLCARKRGDMKGRSIGSVPSFNHTHTHDT